MNPTQPTATGADKRRGVFRAGDRVQLTDAKGRHHTITLSPAKVFHTHRGHFSHDAIIGQDEGSLITTTAGVTYLLLRPLMSDYVLSMPRGAAVIYPKDAGQIVAMADVYPGAVVVEAGVGSGALTLSLLRAVGDSGSLLSIELRDEFAAIAKLNVEDFFGGPHPAWRLESGDFGARVVELCAPHSVDRVILDMLAPWEHVGAAAQVLAPGGVYLAYVATTTQLSRVAEELRDHGEFTEPIAWETMVRTWHLEGLAVRPDHRMIGHTGFLISARRMAPGTQAQIRHRRPAKGSYPTADAEWTPEDVGERALSEKKIRRVHRDLVARAEEGHDL